MGSEAEPEPTSAPKLPLFTFPLPLQSPERSGMLTPPLHTSATVPFRWEEEPGKPRPTTTISDHHNYHHHHHPNKYFLELPPRLQIMEYSSTCKMTKMPSPNTVLDGPYSLGKSVFRSSSLRWFGREPQGSFGSSSCGSPERGQIGAMVLSKRVVEVEEESKERGGGLFGSWRRKKPITLLVKGGKREIDGGSFVLSSSSSSSSMDLAGFVGGGGGGGGGGSGRVKKMSSRLRRNGSSFSSLSQVRSHFWASVYDGLKHVLPWKSRKSKKEGLII